ncbi:MAG: TrkH family potassium uptake protein [Ruminococcus sp.]|nr:TrkH family potassium uptake protein [Ruminococcus sp.]
MNYKMILYIVGQILKIVGLFMLLPIFVGFIYGEKHVIPAFGIPFIIIMVISLLLTIKKPKNNSIFSMEGFVSVAAAWITMSAVGAVPFVIAGEIPHYADALFETVSGFTTTGATILTDVESMSKSCMFWRAFTHWLGGMGVLMFVLAIMSSNDSRTMHMMRAECAGPKVGRLVSKSSFSARILYGIYISLTLGEMIMLMLGGVPLYDAVIHACSSAGTGGFSMWGDSIGHYNSVYVEMVVAVFILLFGVNFNLYYFIIVKKYALAFKNEEVKVYFGVVLTATAIITANIYHLSNGFGDALRHSFFMVASTITSAGFSTADVTQWPVFSQTLLLLLMFVGSCAGSTGGGMKVSRIMILVKTGIKELRYIVNPRAVATVKLDGKPVEKDVVRGAASYFILFMLLMAVSLLLITLNGYSIEESASAVITCMNNIGYGVGRLGPAGTFGGLNSFSKCVLCVDMLLGRLEIYPVILLFAAKKNLRS